MILPAGLCRGAERDTSTDERAMAENSFFEIACPNTDCARPVMAVTYGQEPSEIRCGWCWTIFTIRDRETEE